MRSVRQNYLLQTLLFELKTKAKEIVRRYTVTLNELSGCIRLGERVRRNNEILASLWDAAHPGAQALTGMPHAPGVTDRVGDLAVEIAALEERNEALSRELAQVQAKIDDYICSIPDEYLQIIFRLRFIHCLSWGEVAAIVGKHTSEASVKSACYRYLESRGEL